MKVDAHHHFWRIDRGVYDWIDDDLWELRRDYLPDHLTPYLKQLGIDQTILVQASETLTENAFLLEMAEAADFVGGIVAWVDLMAPDAATQLHTLAQHSIVKGIRPVLQGINDSNWILQKDVLAALRTLPGLGLCFDALIQSRHLPAILTLSHQIPDLRIVIDHAAKPKIANGSPPEPEWQLRLKELGRNPNIYCKISGLATEYGHGWSGQSLAPVSATLLDCFGPSKLMWGSDWPVLERHGSYVQWYAQAVGLIDENDQAAIFGTTAAHFYGLK